MRMEDQMLHGVIVGYGELLVIWGSWYMGVDCFVGLKFILRTMFSFCNKHIIFFFFYK